MQPGEVLHANDRITSADNQFDFVYQDDGNLVLYRNSDGAALWASTTAGTAPGVCIMQTYGNLATYAAGIAPSLHDALPIYPDSHLIAQTDGNVVIYQPDNAPIW